MKEVCRYLHQHSVPDIVHSDVKYLFILESPHRDELLSKTPLAGSAGITVTEVLKVCLNLLDNSTAFGSLMSDGFVPNDIGVFNACSVPLQKVAYPKNSLITEDMFIKLEAIRSNAKLRVRKNQFGSREEFNKIISVIHNRFKRRIKALNLKQDVTIVLCGEFAKDMWNVCFPEDSKAQLHLPHPAKGGWVNPSNTDKIIRLKQLLTSRK
ncbi:TPA: hypothetical protein NG682_004638 [Vibrio parahaemolyticus]|uniref:hypothetical protein n=1 Tax=Vibrio parahaemolyticus TaxID=670 RepID=UPI00112451AD|nr:hypothetical protein [Vibrio parahaemolyticus]EGR1757681.1 hypothetical protein [Vibrio parahaemolyticus]ELB2094423.1 hypothetical protein [Vibrio parahaemolyticus]ELB2126734.1 hypothetical protein [Vibrio parahaemolyticus]MBE4305363.1 hypothetical protein [Vibrio parahaemolyticus]MDF4941762.1 hypothetical protein [Vibrio parahaemolyticus]